MTTAPVPVSYITPSTSLTATQFARPGRNSPRTRMVYQPHQSKHPVEPTGKVLKTLRPLPACIGPNRSPDVTHAHAIAWRQQPIRQGLANDTIRRKLTALSSLYAYPCERHSVWHNPVLGVKRPRSMNRQA